MSQDPQVVAAQNFIERKSLLDVMLCKYNVEDKEPCNPFVIRMLLCGNRGESSLSPLLEEMSNEACMKADVEHPFFSTTRGTSRVTSVLMDYGDRFIQLIEGYERHIYFFLDEMSNLEEKRVVSNVHILFIDDDLEKCAGVGWLFIDKIPAASMTNALVDKSDDEIAEHVLHDLASMLELATVAAEYSGTKRNIFADNAKMNYPKLFPKLELLNAYLRSNFFFSLKDFLDNFLRFPDLTREVEINHPAEDSLKH